MGNLIKKHDKVIHIKTAGIIFLEEVIGLAISQDKVAIDVAKGV